MKKPLLSLLLSARTFSAASATRQSGHAGLWGLATALTITACQSGSDKAAQTASSSPADVSMKQVSLPRAANRAFMDGRKLSLALVSDGPFASNDGQLPPKQDYSGPLFQLSHAYPATLTPGPANPTWRQALHGQPISGVNALAYTYALKAYVAPSMRTMLLHYPQWNAQAAGWFNEPWLGGLRESIHGTYEGSQFPANTFPKSKLKVPMTTYVLTYYDRTAAHTLYKLWGSTALKPDTTTLNVGQFAEGAVIIKLALTTASAQDWPAMAGAAQWPLYIPDGRLPDPDSTVRRRAVHNTSVMQLDIIVKDSKTSPKTGWVFTTLVYDAQAPGRDAWEKMVPLGAMWGDDPNVNSTTNPGAPLAETVINPQAPVYATETLGWGGRLSGPNDGAVVAPALYQGLKTPVAAVAASSCMSCHSVAEHPMKTFLLPNDPTDTVGTKQYPNAGVVAVPGSARWMKWFQNLPGNVPLDAGTLPLDFDMVFAFKSFPAYEAYRNRQAVLAYTQLKGTARPAPARIHNQRYNGL